ncbi:hypothetical protein [Paenibacillus koleovorans]|uniref:hypothetical protein n=1 Tax=Paenibacillus koleovorans TaxID=121608 RepID=UPI000FDC99FE|nr:hypothetical protein [Paenibacillus koleovorans]
MARLEYRLDDAEHGFPLLYFYDFIDKDEVSLRFACDYFVKDRVVYEKKVCSVESNKYILYVALASDEHAWEGAGEVDPYWGGIRIELREFREGTDRYPVVHRYEFQDNDDALLILQSDRLTLQGRVWENTSTEVDEDRKVYVYYAVPGA